MADWMRDQWVEDNLPKDKEFSRGFVAHLMKQAYDEGKKRQDRIKAEDERERLHGPDFI